MSTHRIQSLLVLAFAYGSAACVGFGGLGCYPDPSRERPECVPVTTRCHEGRVETCDADGRWDSTIACGDLSVGGHEWACREAPAGDGVTHMCAPSTIWPEGVRPEARH